MIKNFINFVKRPIIRILLIAWVLCYLLNQLHLPQYLNNILGLPIVIWTVYSIFAALRQAKRERLQLLADIKEFSQVSNPGYFDTCEGSALALNYEQKMIYLIDDKKRKAVSSADILRWEMSYNDGESASAFVVGGNPGSAAGQAVIGAAIGFGIFTLLGRWLNRRNDIGHVKFWVDDAEHTIISVYVSNNKIIEQLQHFSMANGLKIH